ncbi:MAG: SGNH/GDSL hydrolase family protein [Myxococcota bacterium]|nr:hypothetical protein [bacterium]MDP6075071.1 SGNH/GDSL hydrolase family protein [Myxococcota bacterium]MDP6242505.1 SGNH/GDSL hydrolase family protein [Myxococcota bacterium]MDP7074819.1 SGNH/GDSL hydrolase family protein [Myxococcota bacterium]MDP7298860.1 SGNH/GDSL hydrolase family protein [Myxococcota bacterium]
MKHAVGRLWLAGGALALSLGAAELAFRVLPLGEGPLDIEEIWRAQRTRSPAVVDRTGVDVGGERFREEEISEAAFAPGTRRLLFLGDSFTVGAGLLERSDRFTDRVETVLSPGLHVFNAGRGGSNPDRWLRYLELLLPVYRPDAVIAVFFLRNGTLLGTSLALNRKEIEPIRARAEARPLYGRSALLRFFWDRLAWREYTRRFETRMQRSYLGSPEERAMWHHQQDALRAIRDRCRAAGIPFLLVIFPLLLDLNDYRFHAIEDEIEYFAAGLDIPVFSLTPAFLGRDAREVWVASNDQHPNSEGHRIAAERLAPRLRDLLEEIERAN